MNILMGKLRKFNKQRRIRRSVPKTDWFIKKIGKECIKKIGKECNGMTGIYLTCQLQKDWSKF